MKERDVLAFGSIVIDNLLIVNKFPALNETIPVQKYRYTYGGAGANVAVAIARLGGKSGIFAVSGYDFKKTSYEKCLTEQNVDIRGALHTKEFPLSRSFIVSKENSENQILYYYEKKKRVVQLLYENRNLAEKISKDYKVLHFSTGHFEFYKSFLEKHKTKHLISFDPGQETFSYPHRVIKLLKQCHILFMNNHEAKRIKEILKLKSIRKIKGPKLICISLGAEGSIILFKNTLHRIPAVKPSKVADPTGAGDSHRAGFLLALLKGYGIKTAGEIASTVASFTIEAEGAQTSLPTWEKVIKRYEHFFKEKFPTAKKTWKETEKELL